jgi:tungstate transport system ATP-binding protein
MQPVISLKNIRIAQGDNFNLTVDTLDLQPGLIYALTGPNGSGKSTLLRIMALLTKPQTGTVELAGSEPDNLALQRHRVTLVDQSPYLFKGTVADNLAYGLKLRGVGSKERISHIKSTLSKVGLEGFEQRQAKELSGGEVQRVALARALVLNPELLLLDEPTANIDSNSLQAYESLLRGLTEYGITIVFSTHDPSQATRLGEEILRIENSRLFHTHTPGLVNIASIKRSEMYGS